VISGFESNEDAALAGLEKDNTREKNYRAAKLIRDLGMISMGIFMARPDFEEKDFDRLYAQINEMGIAIPLVGILTPLPGTQLWKKMEAELLTKDTRLFDLLHCVLPTKIPRATFYKKLAQMNSATLPSFRKGIFAALRNRPKFWLESIPGIRKFISIVNHYRPIAENHEHHLRDEIGIIPADVTQANFKKRPRALPVVSVAEEEEVTA